MSGEVVVRSQMISIIALHPSINQLPSVVIESKLYILVCELWQFLCNYLLYSPL